MRNKTIIISLYLNLNLNYKVFTSSDLKIMLVNKVTTIFFRESAIFPSI